jgi:hypothetical protein
LRATEPCKVAGCTASVDGTANVAELDTLQDGGDLTVDLGDEAPIFCGSARGCRVAGVFKVPQGADRLLHVIHQPRDFVTGAAGQETSVTVGLLPQLRDVGRFVLVGWRLCIVGFATPNYPEVVPHWHCGGPRIRAVHSIQTEGIFVSAVTLSGQRSRIS